MPLSKDDLHYRVSSSGCWEHYRNPEIEFKLATNARTGQASIYEPFKLHIFVPPRCLLHVRDQETLQAALFNLLVDAVLNDVIPSWKRFILEGHEKFHPRNTHWGHVIFLHPEYTPERAENAIKLCRKIQNLLTEHSVPAGNFKQLTQCDLPVLENVAFRASTTDLESPTYRSTRLTSQDEIAQMRKIGEESPYYRDMKNHFGDVKREEKSPMSLSVPFSDRELAALKNHLDEKQIVTPTASPASVTNRVGTLFATSSSSPSPTFENNDHNSAANASASQPFM